MIERGEPRDLAGLLVPLTGSLRRVDDPWEPVRLCGPGGAVVQPVAVYLRDLQAAGRPETTSRTYATALLRWFRFLWAVEVSWDQATRVEARDFCCWLRFTARPRRGSASQVPVRLAGGAAGGGGRNRVTGKPVPGGGYAPATTAHSESVLRGFYEFHREAGSGPMVNPFPLARGRGDRRAYAHRNPAESPRREKAGLYRPRLARRAPHRIPEGTFNELFAALSCHRDRALVAFWVSSGARAAELLGACYGDVDAGQQLITVIRKGTRSMQQLPASPDAFVWLRLYQAQMHGLVPDGRDDPLWWTLRRPFRALSYHAAYRMFARVNAGFGANWSLHDLRHLAAYRLARDPGMPICDVQWVLGHAHLSTTQLYTAPAAEDVISGVLAHHARRAAAAPAPGQVSSPGYRPETLDVLFGQGSW